MRSPLLLRAALIGAALAVILACESGDRVAPLPPGTGPSLLPQPAPGRQFLYVANGVTGEPVPAVTVRAGGESLVTGRAGDVEVPMPTPCTPATFIAIGFLDRTVTCMPISTTTIATVTLWPVADEAERAALKAFAFPGDQLVRRGGVQLDVRTEPSAQAATVAVWQRAAATLRAVSAAHFTAVLPVNVEALQDGTIVLPWTAASDCVGTQTGWSVPGGYCAGRYTGSAYPYFISVVLVAPDRLDDDAVALRVLLSQFGLQPHPGPGLMNQRDPDPALSDFERRTLKMITLRDRPWPGSITWPDIER